MKTIILPDELILENSKSIQIFNYHSYQEIAKQQIILNQNTFSFLTEGYKEVYFDNTALSINNSEFLIMKAGHCLMTEKLSKTNKYKSILLFFSNDAVLNFIQKNKIEPKKIAIQKSVFAFKYDEFILRFVKSLIDISKLPVKTKDNLLQLKFEEIMHYLTNKYGTTFLHLLNRNNSNPSLKFTQTIESNILNKLTLRELAFLCNMSISTFKREFKKHYSEPPIKWFQNKRLEHANYLLHSEQKNASEIYTKVGYQNLSSFIQAYKAKYKITPKQHQQK